MAGNNILEVIPGTQYSISKASAKKSRSKECFLLGIFLLFFCLDGFLSLTMNEGGSIGIFIAQFLKIQFGAIGATFLLIGGLMLGCSLITAFSWFALTHKLSGMA